MFYTFKDSLKRKSFATIVRQICGARKGLHDLVNAAVRHDGAVSKAYSPSYEQLLGETAVVGD